VLFADEQRCASDDELLIKQGNADSEIDTGNKKSEASRFVPQAQRHTHTSNPGTSSQDSAASAHTRAVTARSQFNGRSGTSNSDNDADEQDAAVEKLTTVLEDFRKSINVKLDAWGIRTQEKMMQRTFLGRFVCSPAFKLMVSVVILVNAITFGVEVDQKLTNPDYKEENWRVLEVFFVVFFSLELLLRAFAERTAFVFGKERWWNLFDAWLVISSMVTVTQTTDMSADIDFFRLLRLARFTRVLRLLRAMRFSESLRVMVFSITSSLVSLMWVFCFFIFVIYFFSVFFLTGIVEERSRLSLADFSPYYDSLFNTLLYSFMSICGGIDWETMWKPLSEVGPIYSLAYVIYIFFMVFGVLNVVVGTFVENSKQQSAKDRDMVTQNGLKQEKEYIMRMRAIFQEADKDGNNNLSWEEFEEYLQDSEVAAFFSSLGLDVSVAKALFVLLDVDDSNAVNIDEFVSGCLRLKGNARSIDVNMLLYENEKLHFRFLDFMDQIYTRFSRVEKTLNIKVRDKANEQDVPPLGSMLVARELLGRDPTSSVTADTQPMRLLDSLEGRGCILGPKD
jgi:voltage-gated sodium channel